MIEIEIHPHIAQAIDFGRNHILGKPEGRNAVNEHAAGLMQGLKDIDLQTGSRADAGTGKGAGARAKTGNLFGAVRNFAGGHFSSRFCGHFRIMAIGDKAFQASDGNWLAFGQKHAFAFALVFLRADPAANGWQAVGGVDYFIGFRQGAVRNLLDEIPDRHFNRTAADTFGLFALQAT